MAETPAVIYSVGMARALSPVTVERFQGDLSNSDRATQQTVERMAKHIHDGAKDPLMWRAAKDALRRYKLPGDAKRAAAWAAWWSVKHNLKFVQDEGLFNSRQCLFDGVCVTVPGRNELEMLVAPSFMVRARKPVGDCDDFTMLVCCLLEVMSVPWEIVTVEADPNEPGQYSHVYAVAVMDDGSRLPLDASHGWGPGWEVPAEHTVRYQAWDGLGRAVSRERAYKRMHGYRPKRRRRGIGDTIDSGFDLTGSQAPTDYYNPTQVFGSDLNWGGGGPAPDFSVPPGGGTNWGNFFQGLTSQGLNLVGKIVAPTATYVRGANGQLMISAPAGANVNPFATVPTSFGGSSLVWIGLGGVALILVFAAMGKK